MNELIERGILPPEKVRPAEGYKEMKILFWRGKPEVMTGAQNYRLNDDERDVISAISDKFNEHCHNAEIDGYVAKWSAPRIAETLKIEQNPEKKHVFSKWLDFAIGACLLAEILAAVRWIL